MENEQKQGNKNYKKQFVKWIIVCLIVFVVCVTIIFFLFINTDEMHFIKSERIKIENTPFFATQNEEFNNELGKLNYNRLEVVIDRVLEGIEDNSLEPENVDKESVQVIGNEIQKNMEILTDMIDNIDFMQENYDEIENWAIVLEEYFTNHKNLQELRNLDRVVSLIMLFCGEEYTQFYSHKHELSERQGRFIVEYEEPQHPKYKKFYLALKDSEVFNSLIEKINSTFYFDREHFIIFTEMDEINASYHLDTKNITVGYELLEFVYTNLKKELNSVNKSEEILIDSICYIVVHELGHAFIDIYDLQFIGSEEDVVDDLSVILAIEFLGFDSEDLVESLISAAYYFSQFLGNRGVDLLDSEEELVSLAYADTHSLESQRVLDILTLIHGVRPLETEFLTLNSEGKRFRLSRQTASNSPDRYLDTSNFWYNALFPYMKIDDSE